MLLRKQESDVVILYFSGILCYKLPHGQKILEIDSILKDNKEKNCHVITYTDTVHILVSCQFPTVVDVL